MSEDRIVEVTPHTTIVERRGSGGGLLIGLAVLIAVVIAGFYFLNQSRNDNLETKAVTSAAKSVGSAADKAGSAIDKATE